MTQRVGPERVEWAAAYSWPGPNELRYRRAKTNRQKLNPGNSDVDLQAFVRPHALPDPHHEKLNSVEVNILFYNMRLPLLSLFLLFPVLAFAQSEGEVLRIKLEWLNAKECGFEGCKPQNLVLKNGSSITFGWPKFQERGFFEVSPSVAGNSAQIKIKRFKKTEGSSPVVTSSAIHELQFGEPKEVVLEELRLRLTLSRENQNAK